MALDVATLGIRVDANGAITVLDQFGKKLGETQQKASLLEQGMGKLKSAAGMLGVSLGAGVIFHKFITETMESQRTMAQLEAVIRSTGMAAGFSAAQLSETAAAMQQMTTYSDDAIMSAQSLLLTFTQIKGDTFTGATEAVANLATALGTDLKSAALQVGKALNDPAQGLAAMRRSGVSFSEAQQTVINLLFESGQKAEAQAMILKELNVQFGGAASAAKNTFGGALAGLNNSLGDLFELSTDSTGAVVAFIQEIDRAVRSLNEASGAIKGVAYTLGAAGLAGGIAVAGSGMAALVGGIATLSEAFVAAQLYANAFWVAVTGPVGLAVAGLTTVAVVMARISGDDAKANAAMKAREDADAYMAQQALKRHREKIKAEEELALQRRAAALQAAVDAKKRADADEAELAGLDAKIRRENVLAEAKQRVIDRINAEKEAARGLTPFAQVGIRDVPTVDETFTPAIPSPTNATGTAAIDGWLKLMKRLEAGWAAMSAAREQIEANFLRGLQDSFARTFENVFTHGLRGFKDLFATVGTLIAQTAAQMAASGLTTAITKKYDSAGGGTAGISAVANSGAGLGLLATGFIALGAAMIESGRAARAHAKALDEARQKFTESLTDRIAAFGLTGQDKQRADIAKQFRDDLTTLLDTLIQARNVNVGTRADFLAADRAGQRTILQNSLNREMAYSGTQWFKPEVVKALQDAIKQFDLITQAADRAVRAMEEELAFKTTMFESDLRVRELRASGYSDEADALALFNHQAQEFRDAFNAGWSEELLARLGQVQELERKQAAAAQAAAAADRAREQFRIQEDAQLRILRATDPAAYDAAARAAENRRRIEDLVRQGADDATIALEKLAQQAESAAAAAEAAAAAQAKAAAQAAAVQDIEVELLRAKGKTAEADQRAFDLEQQRRLEEARKTQSDEYIARLLELQALERAARTAGVSMGDSTGAASGRSSSLAITSDVGTKVSALVGDRMLDNLVSMRVILRQIEINTRTIGSRVNAALGSSLQAELSLAGNALVS